jgi:secretion/DNA translocation related CpaE-like protein
MTRTARSVSRAAAQLAGGRGSPGRAGGPAIPETPSGRPRPYPLIVTADPDLLDDLLRLAANAGVTPDVAPDPVGARPWYPRATRVFIGADMAESCARAGLPRRFGVVLVLRESSGVPRTGSNSVASASGPEPASADWSLAEQLGAEHVVVLPAAEPWIASEFARLTDEEPPEPARTIAVLGGRGGAGATVLAGALAVTGARQGLRTLLVDADPLGGGVDLVLGWESLDGLRWPALSGASGRVPAPALVDALPGRSELAILSWDRGEPSSVPPEAMLAALDAGRRGRDLTVVDLPRQLDESSMLALRAADQVYLVVPAELRACAAAARVAAVAQPHCSALSVVVRKPGPGGITVKEVVAALRLPYAGAIRSEPRLRAAWERGEPPAAAGRGPLATLCEKLLADVMRCAEGVPA